MADDTSQTSTTARSNTVIPPPPRISDDEDPAVVIKKLSDWFNDFYRSAVIASGLLDPKYQASTPTFDGNNLAAPSNTTIGQAQQTANEAYNLAKSLESRVTALETP
jgi:hypothetical protein